MKFSKTIHIFVFLILALTYGCSHKQLFWPEIKETSQAYDFYRGKKEKFEMSITDKHGNCLYYLDARLVSDSSDNEKTFYFSGTIDCRLVQYKERNIASLNLFQNVRNATRDWQSDARFLHNELIGLIGSPASRSIVQRCKVRGMYIEIEINNVFADNEGGIQGLKFKITFLNDPTAKSDISEGQSGVSPEQFVVRPEWR